VSGSAVYVVGPFIQANGEARPGAAAFATSDGSLTSWNPEPGPNNVQALVVSGSTVYLGGFFTGLGGSPRSRLAAVSASDGTVLPWNPHVETFIGAGVYALALDGNVVYAGGEFTDVDGWNQFNLTAVDASSGAAYRWTSPDPNLLVAEVRPLPGGRLAVGGAFWTMRFGAVSGLAILGPTRVPVALSRSGAGIYYPLGEVLKCEPAEWSSVPTSVKLEWLRDGVVIEEAERHQLGDADVGHEMSCRATATPGGHYADARRFHVRVELPSNQSLPSIQGEPAVGSTLTCYPGEWGYVAGSPYSY
jgi:hypothetical protein